MNDFLNIDIMFTPGPHLGYIAGGENQIVKERPLAPDELKFISEAREVLTAFNNHPALVSIVSLNVADFRQYLQQVAGEHRQPSFVALPQIILNANRLVLNVLTALRTFRDHSRTIAYRRYGRRSQFVADWQALIATKEKQFFSYRFLYDLRNYVQHCGMPVGQVSFTSRQNETTHLVERAAQFDFDRDALLHDYNDWAGDVRAGLDGLPKHFAILPFLEDVLECVAQMAIGTMALELPQVRAAVVTLRGFIAEVSQTGARPCIITEWLEADGSPNLSIAHLPLDALTVAERLIEDNDAGRLPLT